MKIDRVNNVSTRGVRAGTRGRSEKTDGFFKALGSADSGSPATVSGNAPVSGVDALLSVQEIGGESDAESQGQRRGKDLLDRLDELRLDLLEGRLAASTIQRLADLAASQRAQVRDPRLAEILDEIELRAAVELAKLGR